MNFAAFAFTVFSPRWRIGWCASVLALAGLMPAQAQPALPADAPRWLAQLPATPLLLMGEQHDNPSHQALQRAVVLSLAQRGQLAALVLEMAEQGGSSAGLPPQASEADVQQALRWGDAASGGWPWAVYGPVVMAAVAAGVPVLGGNLPRAEMRAVMVDDRWDRQVPAAALAEQQAQMREGHCGLLPERQVLPMARIQIARDQRLSEVARAALKPGQTVLLVAGNGHVRRDLGIPLHLPSGQAHHVLMLLPTQTGSAQAHTVWPTPPGPDTDHCAELRQQMGQPTQPPAGPTGR